MTAFENVKVKHMKKIGILGSGSWGMALAKLLADSGHSVEVWSVDFSDLEKQFDGSYIHKNLQNAIIPASVQLVGNLEALCKGKDMILVAVASVYVRETMRKASAFISSKQIVVSFSKGIENETNKTMSEIISEELGAGIDVVIMSGPSHAEEVALELPTTIIASCSNEQTAQIVQKTFSNHVLRVYTNTDTKGVELCGALKNIIALATGIATGLGYGDNAKAAIITRGLAEMQRLGACIGCKSETFFGLAGIGDLIVTATSKHSRNFRCGLLIGQGIPVGRATEIIGMAVEGLNALPAAIQIADTYQVDMPIIRSVQAVVTSHMTPMEAGRSLMSREMKSEQTRSIPYVETILDQRLKSNLKKNGEFGMKRVITYGTFDLLHYGHINLLKRAKALGDYLIVVISTDEFNWNEKHKKCYFTYEQRKALVEALRYVDLVIPENSWDQKRTDIHEYHVDTFVMGDDWKGKFDFLREEGAEVVYLPRTPEISSSQIKHDLNAAADVGESKTSHDDINTDPS